MSSNRKKYDNCCVKDQVKQSTKPFDLLMDSCAFERKMHMNGYWINAW